MPGFLGEIRDALLFALAEPLDQPHRASAIAAAVAARLGRNPLPEIAALGQLRANPHLGPGAEPLQAARAIEEELTRHAALSGRAAEIREAVAEAEDHLDDALTMRVRAAGDAEQVANTRPLEDDQSADELERVEFATLINIVEATRSRKPRKR